jgi:hypothetical protein
MTSGDHSELHEVKYDGYRLIVRRCLGRFSVSPGTLLSPLVDWIDPRLGSVSVPVRRLVDPRADVVPY